MSVKVVYSPCYGGFGISVAAAEWLTAHGVPMPLDGRERSARHVFLPEGIERHHPALVACVETLGKSASGSSADLKVKELRGTRYRITDYDGFEEVVEPEGDEWIEVRL